MRCGGVILLLILWAVPAWADQVLVIKSRDLGLYNQAVAGVMGSYRVDRGERVRVMDLGAPDTASATASPPDVIIAVGAAATRYAVEHYNTPVIYCMVARPERLALPPRAVGISMFVPVADMLATLRLAAPNLRYVGVLHGPAHRKLIRNAVAHLTGFEVKLIPVEVTDDRRLPELARRLVLQADALWVVPGTVTSLDAMQFLLKLSTEHRVPLIADSPAMVRAGALLAVTPDPVDLGRQAARLAGYLLSGEGLPPDRLFYPDMANLAVNLKTAHALGIRVPPMLAEFASVVVE